MASAAQAGNGNTVLLHSSVVQDSITLMLLYRTLHCCPDIKSASLTVASLGTFFTTSLNALSVDVFPEAGLWHAQIAKKLQYLPVCYNQPVVLLVLWLAIPTLSVKRRNYCLFCPSKACQGVRKVVVTSK